MSRQTPAARPNDVGLGLLLDADARGRVIVEDTVPGSVAHESGQVLRGDEVVEIEGIAARGKHAQEIKALLLGQPTDQGAATFSIRLNRGGRMYDVKLPRGSSISPSRMRRESAGVNPHVHRAMPSGGIGNGRKARLFALSP